MIGLKLEALNTKNQIFNTNVYRQITKSGTDDFRNRTMMIQTS